jgi:putative transcriptional regulator
MECDEGEGGADPELGPAPFTGVSSLPLESLAIAGRPSDVWPTGEEVRTRMHGAMKKLKGRLLISSGGLFDPNFRHTVVLLAEHNADGAVGVVLNRPLNVTVAKAIPALASLVRPHELLFQGGPVQPSTPALLAELADPGLVDVLAFGSVGFLVEEISPDLRSQIRRARVYVGYSSWGPGQLEAEMDEQSWIVEPAREEDVFTEAPERLWSRVLERKGPEYRRLSRMPFDPSMN